jgi:ATP-binding cassette subfamily B (MDR/TAP) protein 1
MEECEAPPDAARLVENLDRDHNHFVTSNISKWKFDIFQLLGTFAAIGAGSARPLMTLVYGGLVNEFNNYKDTSALGKTVDSEVLYLVYLFIGQWALTCIYGIFLSISAMKYSRRLRAAYLKSAIRQESGLVSQGKVADNLATSIDVIEDALSEKLGIVMQAGSTIIVSLIIAFVHNWQLTLVLFSTIFLLFLSNFGTAALDTKLEQRAQESEEEAATFAEECLNGIRIVMACVAETKLSGNHAAFLEKAKGIRMRKSPILAVQYSMSYLGLLASYALAFWYGTILLNQGKIESGGTIVMCVCPLLAKTFVDYG